MWPVRLLQPPSLRVMDPRASYPLTQCRSGAVQDDARQQGAIARIGAHELSSGVIDGDALRRRVEERLALPSRCEAS